MKCPLYDETRSPVHGLRCTSPITPPTVDCQGSLASNRCTVPAVAWRVMVVELAGAKQPNETNLQLTLNLRG